MASFSFLGALEDNLKFAYHQKTGIATPLAVGLVRGSINLNLRHST